MSNILENKVSIITGSSKGLGLEIARTFLKNGSHIILNSRNEKELISIRDQLNNLNISSASIEIFQGDISSEEACNELINFSIEKFGDVDILVNNAGVYGPMGPVETNGWKVWRKAFEINFYGSAYLISAILPHFKKKNEGKIIQLSGGGATKPLPNFSSYSASKSAIVRFCETVSEEVRDYNIQVNCVAPGGLNTQMLDQVLEQGPKVVGKNYYEQAIKQKESGGASLAEGSNLILFLASEESNGISGKLISAVWDNWGDFTKNIEKLSSSDVYTLRRVVGKDRDFKEGDV